MTRSALRAEDRRFRRGDVLAALFALVLGSAVAWIVLSIQGMAHDLQEKDTDIAALSQQVRSLGGKPVAGPPGQAGKSVVGPRGPRGEKGDTGASGKPAPTITPSPGRSGASGAPGKDGADSTVPGPTGPPGADSTVPGPSGPPGRDGRDGVDGKDGQTCPDGYHLEAPSYDPDALVCRKDNAPDPGGSDSQSPQTAALDPRRKDA